MSRALSALFRSSRRAIVPRPVSTLPTLSKRYLSVDAPSHGSDQPTPTPNQHTPKYNNATPPLEPPQLEQPAPANVEVKARSMKVENGRELRYINLRDACKCPRCVDPHSKQRSFRTSDIHVNIVPRNIKWDGQQLEIQWKNDIKGYDASHTTVHDRRSIETPTDGYYKGHSRSIYTWNAEIMRMNQHWVSYEDYMNDDAKFAEAMRNLSIFGLIFVKNIPESREMVEKLATRMGPLRNTFYGPTWDVRSIPEAKNVAYTSQFLGFHMDLMYMNEPPGYQLLHCLHNSCEGGESLFADSFYVAELMRHHTPKFFKSLCHFHLRYEYLHKDSVYKNRWPVFETYNGRNGPQTIGHVNYAPPFQTSSIEDASIPPTLQQFGLKALNAFARYLEYPKNMFELKLNPGECVIFENRRVVHARRQFNTNQGERWLAGAYVDEDALMSRFSVCHRNHPEVWNKAERFKKPTRPENKLSEEESWTSV